MTSNKKKSSKAGAPQAAAASSSGVNDDKGKNNKRPRKSSTPGSTQSKECSLMNINNSISFSESNASSRGQHILVAGPSSSSVSLLQPYHHSIPVVSHSSSTTESESKQMPGQESSSHPSNLWTAPQCLNGGSVGGGGGVHQQHHIVGSPLFSPKASNNSSHHVPTPPPKADPDKNSICAIDMSSQQISQQLQHPDSPNKHHDHNATSEERRLERNQREKERSNRIASQVDALRCLLQRGGLFIPKNTKSTVLSEASNYIRTLQDRQQLMSLEMEGLKRQLMAAMAAREGQMEGQQQVQAGQQVTGRFLTQETPQNEAVVSSEINDANGANSSEQDYQLIFQNTMAGMAVASMGGALLDW